MIASQFIEPVWIGSSNTTEIVGVEQNKIDRNDNVYLTSFAIITVIFVIVFTVLILWRK